MLSHRSSTVPGDIKQPLAWIFLSFVPASLLIGVTTYSMTKTATAPLLWLVPVSIFLQSLFLALAVRSPRLTDAVTRRFAIPVTVVLFLTLTSMPLPAWYVVPLHMVAFGMAALMCHSHLSEMLPPVTGRVRFFVCVAAGAALGVLFNVTVAPHVFNRLQEYPLMLAIAALVPVFANARRVAPRIPVHAVIAPLAIAALAFFVLSPARWFVGNTPMIAAAMAIPAVMAFSQSRRPRRFAASLIAMVVVATAISEHQPRVPRDARTFFGAPQHSLEQHLRQVGRTSKGF
jgi:hypothetical protein